MVPLVVVAELVYMVLALDKRVERQARESLLQERQACSRAHTSSSKPQVSPGEWKFTEKPIISSGFKQITCLTVMSLS